MSSKGPSVSSGLSSVNEAESRYWPISITSSAAQPSALRVVIRGFAGQWQQEDTTVRGVQIAAKCGDAFPLQKHIAARFAADAGIGLLELNGALPIRSFDTNGQASITPVRHGCWLSEAEGSTREASLIVSDVRPNPTQMDSAFLGGDAVFPAKLRKNLPRCDIRHGLALLISLRSVECRLGGDAQSVECGGQSGEPRAVLIAERSATLKQRRRSDSNRRWRICNPLP